MARNSAIPERERALDLLLSGWSPPAIAKEVGVGRTTLWRWTQDPEFVAELQRRRRDRRELVQTVLVDSSLEAVAVLHEVMTDKTVGAAVRVKAAEALLSRAGLEETSTETDNTRNVIDALLEVKRNGRQVRGDWGD